MNAIEHGANFDPDKFVEISYLVPGTWLCAALKIPEKAFRWMKFATVLIQPTRRIRIQHANYREEHGMRAGGYGVLVAKSLVDAQLIFDEKGNNVLLIKYLGRSGGSDMPRGKAEGA